MNGDSARIQASFLLDGLTVIRRSAGGDRVIAALPTGLLARIEAATRVDWLELADHLRFAEITYATLGKDDAHTVWHETMLQTFREGVLKRLGGRDLSDPTDILRHGPRAWAQMTRGCGVQEFHERAPGAVSMLWRDLPPTLVGSKPYLEAMCAKYKAHLTVVRVAGNVRLSSVDPLSRSAQFDLEWERREAAV